MNYIRVLTAVAVSALISTSALADDPFGRNHPVGGGLDLSATFASSNVSGNGYGSASVTNAYGATEISNFAGVESVASITPSNSNCNCTTELSAAFAGVSQSITAAGGVGAASISGGGSLYATNIAATGSVKLPK